MSSALQAYNVLKENEENGEPMNRTRTWNEEEYSNDKKNKKKT